MNLSVCIVIVGILPFLTALASLGGSLICWLAQRNVGASSDVGLRCVAAVKSLAGDDPVDFWLLSACALHSLYSDSHTCENVLES